MRAGIAIRGRLVVEITAKVVKIDEDHLGWFVTLEVPTDDGQIRQVVRAGDSITFSAPVEGSEPITVKQALRRLKMEAE